MITFVATAYEENYDAFQFASCLLLQSNKDWKAVIYCDKYNKQIEDSVNYFADNRFKIVTNLEPKKFWGHYNRIDALYNHVDTEYVIQTSIQDYYTPNTVEEILKLRSYDFVYFNCIHNHIKHDILNTELIRNKIDWGNFACKTEIAKIVGINNPQSSICDGLFVEELVKYISKEKIFKINKILTVHN